MSAHREEYADLCAALVLGCLDEADRLELETHRAGGCAQCESEIARLSQVLPMLAAAAVPSPPPEALRARVLDAVRREGAAPGARAPAGITLRPARRPSSAIWAWAAAAVVLAIATVSVWRANVALRRSLSASEAERGRLHAQLDDARRWAALLDSPDARVVDLALTPAGRAALRARATFDPTTGRAVILFENFVTPSGYDYELWAIRGRGPASLGLIHADASGRAVVKLDHVDDPSGLQAFAVSLERAGGSGNPNAPGGPVVMVGKVGT